MGISLSTWMIIAFVAGMALSIWKLYPFLTTKTLEDDDNTPEAKEALLNVVLDTIKQHGPSLTLNELYIRTKEHPSFDKEHFWRFNPNKLKHLLDEYYMKHSDINSIEDIYNTTRS